LQPAREIEQQRQLNDIIAQKQAGLGRSKPQTGAPAQREEDVEPGAERDDAETGSQRQWKVQNEMDPKNRQRLPEYCKPAQAHQGSQAQKPCRRIEGFRALGSDRSICHLALALRFTLP